MYNVSENTVDELRFGWGFLFVTGMGEKTGKRKINAVLLQNKIKTMWKHEKY